MKKIFVLLLSTLLLISCANEPSYGDKIVALNIAPEDMQDLYSIEIPTVTKGNVISHGLMLATNKMFSNPTSNMIKDMLDTKPNIRLAIIGNSQTNNFFNLQHALKKCKGQYNAIIYINVSNEQLEVLSQLAKPKGITIKNGNR